MPSINTQQQSSKLNRRVYLILLILTMIQTSQSSTCWTTIANCYSCEWGNRYSCDGCNSGYTIVTGHCCFNHCTACSANSICSACENGYCLSSNNCLKCDSFVTGCSTCSNCGTCSTCQAPSLALAAPTTCTACNSLMTDCIECSSSTACTKCANNTLTVDAGPNPDECVLCSQKLNDCETCGDVSGTLGCYTCVDDTFAVKSADHKCHTCSSLLTKCLTCSNQTFCTLCQATYAFSSPSCQLCSALMTDCTNCTSANVCTECVNTSMTVNSSNLCALCSTILTACSTCSSSAICTTCNDTSYVISSNQCVTCISLMTACLNCSTTTNCSTCINDTYALNSTDNKCYLCSAFMSQCVNCSSTITCTSCINNSYALNSTFRCKRCYTLMSNCLYCNSSSICTKCVNNSFALNTTDNQCLNCSAFLDYCLNCNSSTICINCSGSPNVILNGQICSYCNVVLPNCLNCTSRTNCTLCNRYYIVSSTFSCVLCGTVMYGCIQCTSTSICTKCSFGHIVSNGCSSVPGCISVIQQSSTSTCSMCNSTEYSSTAPRGACICLKGHLAGQYCTEIIGCVNIVRNIYGDTCIACDNGNKFNLENSTCVCQQYYQLSGSVCVQICGDGRLINLPCDDGNLIDGDGCSSSCQKEADYDCSGGTITSPSKCIYQGLIKLQYVCAYKLQENNAQIVLTTSPFISNFVKSSSTILFNTSKNCTMNSYKYSGSNIILDISYLQDIEGYKVKFSIQYDKNYIISPNHTIEVQLNECQGDKMLYDPDPAKSLRTTIVFIVKILSIAVLVLWFIGSYSHKMIGVETLHTFQFISVQQVLASKYFPVLAYFSDLCNTLNIYQGNNSSTPLGQKYYSRLNYSADFVYNNGFVVILQLIILIVFVALVYLFKIKCNQEQKRVLKKKERIIQINNSKLKQFLYDFLVFPVFIGFFLNSMLSLIVYSNVNIQKTFQNYYIQTFTILFAFISSSIIYFYQWKQFLIKKSYQQYEVPHKQNYIPLYLTNFFLLCLFIQGSIASIIPNPIYLLLGLNLGYNIVIIIYRPYRFWLHNLGLIVNNTGVIFNICWEISQDFIYLKREKEEFIALILIAWMILMLIIAILRIIFQLRKKKQLNLQNNQEQVKLNKQFNDYSKQMMKAIQNQQSSKVNSYLVKQQLTRIKKIEQSQLYLQKIQKINDLLSKQKEDRIKEIMRNNIRQMLRRPIHEFTQNQL